MEQKLNIAEILKNKPRGTKLYSMIHGKCSSEAVTDEIFKINFCTSKFGLTQSGECTLIKFGNMYDGGECIIFPSKEMRDWSKFQWEKGDVLISNDGGTEVIFDKWYDDTYTSFYCKHYLNSEDKNKIVYYEEFLCTTERYSLEDKDIAQTYINTIEEQLGGKLNLETLKIEKQLKFKDGDVVTIMPHIGDKLIYLLFKAEDDEKYYGHAFLDGNIAIVNEDSYCQKDFCTARPSTDEEEQQLFSALAKKNMAWDAEKKQIVDLKSNVELKPFDKVVVRDTEYSTWCADLFSHIDEDYRYACVGATWSFCIPYNEETAKLIGTTNNVED